MLKDGGWIAAIAGFVVIAAACAGSPPVASPGGSQATRTTAKASSVGIAPTAASAASPTQTAVRPGYILLEHVGNNADGTVAADTEVGTLWLVKADGSDLHQVAAGQPDTLFAGSRATGYNGKLGAAWSPDGVHIAFQTESDAATPIWETDVNSAAPRLLSTDCERLKWTCGDIWPAYSPDGKLLAFDRRTFDPDPSGVIAIRDLATGKVTLLESTRQGPPNQELGRAAWSPNGKQLAYYVVPKDTAGGDDAPLGTSVIYVVNADGTGVHTLETPGLAAGDPAWSPDGSLIVFSTTPLHEWESTGVEPFPNVYVIRPDGTGLVQLTHDYASASPSWTSDGKILFSNVDNDHDPALWLMDADGSNLTRIGPGSMRLLSAATGYTFYAHWQPTLLP